MGTLASKVGENIVGKRLGMSEKDRKLLGTVFGMAGGAYGGYAGSAGFGSSGIGATGASGSAGGMGGSSPKVGGDYGTAMNLYSQPTVPGAGPGYYGSGPVGNVSNTGYQYIPAMGTEYAPIEASNNPYISQYVGNADAPADIGYFANPVKPNPYLGPNVGNADAPADLFQMNAPINGYNQMASMPVETYGMDQYRLTDMSQVGSSTRAQELYNRNLYNDLNLRQQGNSYFDMANTPIADYNYSGMDSSAFLDSRPTPVYQGPVGPDTSAQTYAIGEGAITNGGWSRIPSAPSGTPLEVIDVSMPSTASGSNLGMESVYNSGGNLDIELVPSTGGGYSIDPEGINMNEIRLQEMDGGLLDPFGTGPNITAANYSVSGPPQSVGSYIENGPIIDNSLNADPRNLYQNTPQSAFVKAPVDSVGRPILGKTIAQDQYLAATGGDSRVMEAVSQSKGDYNMPRATGVNTPPKGVKIGPKGDLSVKLKDVGVDVKDAPLTNKAIDDLMSKAEEVELNTRAIERETETIADAMRYEIPQNSLEKLLSKIPDSVKQWAAETGVALLDMWIKKSLFGQDYDDQIAEGGGGGGGVLRGSSPVVSPYSGGGSGGGGKGVLFSMGGSGQQGRGTHIMALQ